MLHFPYRHLSWSSLCSSHRSTLSFFRSISLKGGVRIMAQTRWLVQIMPISLVLTIKCITSNMWLGRWWGAMFFGGKGGSLFPIKRREGNLAQRLGWNQMAMLRPNCPCWWVHPVAPLKHTTINVRTGGDGLERLEEARVVLFPRQIRNVPYCLVKYVKYVCSFLGFCMIFGF